MRIKPDHFNALKVGVDRVLAEQPSVSAQSYLDQGLSNMRFRWDALLAAISYGYVDIDGETKYPIGNLYRYCNDNHIDTALRRITGTK